MNILVLDDEKEIADLVEKMIVKVQVGTNSKR